MTLIAFNCLYSRFLPESIRWLISKKKYCQARELIIKASKMNGVLVPEHLIVIPDNDKESVSSEGSNANNSENQQEEKSETIIDVFRSPVLCKRICVMFIAW